MKDKDIYAETLSVIMERTKETLEQKNNEYASQQDPYHNFDITARITGSVPEKALWGMYLKHFTSVMDMVESGQCYPDEHIMEKICDSINYHILLAGLLRRKAMQKHSMTQINKSYIP